MKAAKRAKRVAKRARKAAKRTTKLVSTIEGSGSAKKRHKATAKLAKMPGRLGASAASHIAKRDSASKSARDYARASDPGLAGRVAALKKKAKTTGRKRASRSSAYKRAK